MRHQEMGIETEYQSNAACGACVLLSDFQTLPKEHGQLNSTKVTTLNEDAPKHVHFQQT